MEFSTNMNFESFLTLSGPFIMKNTVPAIQNNTNNLP